ncbi:hypothetical protein EZV62_001855 [Acer yangbiense]|uniref:F-box associated beta-propeller type 1 domain-containing protein n=1 Tax=Acer yangbiense TaxID=1000413 RepID=A0A5C7IXV3_9ROSI|nr:hypothetical protein EZV62_001855 [Acer yangbiense]
MAPDVASDKDSMAPDVETIFPSKDRSESINHLMKAVKFDQSPVTLSFNKPFAMTGKAAGHCPYNAQMLYDGFGYDGVSDYYKLIRTVKSSESWIEVTIYSLRDNTWRMIEDDFPYLLDIFHGIGTLVGGALNWIVGGKVSVFDYGNFILSFDLKK